MKNYLILLFITIFSLILFVSCYPIKSNNDLTSSMKLEENEKSSMGAERIQSDLTEIAAGLTINVGDSIELENIYNKSQKVKMKVLSCEVFSSPQQLDIDNYADHGYSTFTEDGSLNPLLNYENEEQSSLVLVQQSVTNLSEENIFIYVNASKLVLNEDDAIGFNIIYFDGSEVERSDRSFYKKGINAGETVEFTIGFVVGDNQLNKQLYYLFNPFGLSLNDAREANILKYVVLPL